MHPIVVMAVYLALGSEVSSSVVIAVDLRPVTVVLGICGVTAFRSESHAVSSLM